MQLKEERANAHTVLESSDSDRARKRERSVAVLQASRAKRRADNHSLTILSILPLSFLTLTDRYIMTIEKYTYRKISLGNFKFTASLLDIGKIPSIFFCARSK